MGQKSPKMPPDPDYLARVRELPCCVCEAFHHNQASPTHAHHVIHDRHSQHKTPDREAIPLCEGHHQGGFDTSKVAIHREPQRWRKLFGPDWSYTKPTQARLAEQSVRDIPLRGVVK